LETGAGTLPFICRESSHFHLTDDTLKAVIAAFDSIGFLRFYVRESL
jgi:hypothetical protein